LSFLIYRRRLMLIERVLASPDFAGLSSP